MDNKILVLIAIALIVVFGALYLLENKGNVKTSLDISPNTTNTNISNIADVTHNTTEVIHNKNEHNPTKNETVNMH